GRLVQMLKADENVVNGVAPHPSLPLLATCGIDSDGKVWGPGEDESTFDEQKAQEVLTANKRIAEAEAAGGYEGGISLLNLWNFLQMLRAREERSGSRGEDPDSEEEEGEERMDVSVDHEEMDEDDLRYQRDMERIEEANSIRARG